MVVEGCNLDATSQQPLHDRVYFFLSQHEIANDHGLAAHFLKRQPASKREARFYIDPIKRDFEVCARQPYAVHATRHFGSSFAESFTDLRPGFRSEERRVGKECRSR